MYKTTVYTLINGRITHQKQQISKKWHHSAVHWHFGNVMLRNITFYLIFAVFDVYKLAYKQLFCTLINYEHENETYALAYIFKAGSWQI